MPSHSTRIRLNYICPYCKGYMLDGRHNFGRMLVNGVSSFIIGCPEHSKYSPLITIMYTIEGITS